MALLGSIYVSVGTIRHKTEKAGQGQRLCHEAPRLAAGRRMLLLKNVAVSGGCQDGASDSCCLGLT